MLELGLQHLWLCRWMRMQIEGGLGDVKPLVGLSTPQRLRCNVLPQQIKDAASQSEHPLGTHYIQSIYIFIQTNSWLHMLSWANDKRQMCPPLRIQFDKPLLHKLLNTQTTGMKKALCFTWEWMCLENVPSHAGFVWAVNVNFMSDSFSIHPCDCFIPLHENRLLVYSSNFSKWKTSSRLGSVTITWPSSVL